MCLIFCADDRGRRLCVLLAATTALLVLRWSTLGHALTFNLCLAAQPIWLCIHHVICGGALIFTLTFDVRTA